MGCVMATLFKVRTAAYLRVGRGELRKSWSTVEQIKQGHCKRGKTNKQQTKSGPLISDNIHSM